MRSSVDFWYLRISRRATVPGLYLYVQKASEFQAKGKKSQTSYKNWVLAFSRMSCRYSIVQKLPVRLLDTACGGCGLASCLGGQLLAGSLASRGLPCCLLCTSHDFKK